MLWIKVATWVTYRSNLVESKIPHASIWGTHCDSDISTWALPKGAISRLGRGRVQDVTFSPDGMYFAVGTCLGVWIYKFSSMDPLALLDTERGMVSAVTFSPCGKRLAIGNWDGLIKVWDVLNNLCITQMKWPGEESNIISQIVFSPDGQHIAASCAREDTIHIWHAETGKEVVRLSGNTDRSNIRLVRPLIFSPDGTLLVYASSDDTHQSADSISVWRVDTGERVAFLRRHTAYVYGLSFSPCGQFLASGDRSGTLQVWDVPDAKPVSWSTEYAENYPVIPSYAPCGTLLAASIGKSMISVWNVERSEKLDMFEHHGNISVVCFSNGTHLVVASPFEFRLWTADGVHTSSSVLGHTHVPFSLTFSHDGQTLISVGSGLATCWNIPKKQRQQMLYRAQTAIRAIHITPTGNMQAIGNIENTLCAWDVESPNTLSVLTEHQKAVHAVARVPTTERWASGDIKGKLYVWDGKRELIVLSGHTDSITSLAFTPDGKRLASASRDKTARFWDVASGEEVASLSLTQLLDTKLYKGDSREIQRRCKSLARGVTDTRPIQIETIAVSPCGNIVAGGLWREIRLWDATTYEIRMSILPPVGCYYPFALAFSPCARYLAVGSWWQRTEKVSIRLWEIATGKNIATFWGHPTDVQDLAFSPDGVLLASGSFDGTILLWDLKPYL